LSGGGWDVGCFEWGEREHLAGGRGGRGAGRGWRGGPRVGAGGGGGGGRGGGGGGRGGGGRAGAWGRGWPRARRGRGRWAVVPGRQVVEPRDAAEPDLVERARERTERVRDVLVLEPHPRDAARGVVGQPGARRLAVEAAGLAPRRDRLGVIVVVVGAEPVEH